MAINSWKCRKKECALLFLSGKCGIKECEFGQYSHPLTPQFFSSAFFYFTIFSSPKLLGTLGANLLGNLLIGKGTLKTDEDAIRVGQDF